MDKLGDGLLGVKNRLREIRHELLIDKKKDMAELLDLTPANYSRYEHQKIQPSVEMVLKMAKKLNRAVEEIVYLDESPGN